MLSGSTTKNTSIRNLPDLEEAKALGGAQALWDKETAEHEAFRAAHPAP
jgi:hypothetical protein